MSETASGMGGARATSQRTLQPAVGRTVLYNDGGLELAAIITGLNPDETISLHVFGRARQFDVSNIAMGTTSGCWNWPTET
jgi:hypothetical protein